MRLKHHDEAGFTLVEALVSVLVLVFGLIAVTNLFLVGGTSNQTANHMSTATTEALETLEALKAIPFASLAPGGDLNNDLPAVCQPDCAADPDLCPGTCVAARPGPGLPMPFYNYYRTVPGVGMIRTRWIIGNPIPGAAGAPVCFIMVRSESVAPLVGGFRSRAEFTTFRTCATANCPLECI